MSALQDQRRPRPPLRCSERGLAVDSPLQNRGPNDCPRTVRRERPKAEPSISKGGFVAALPPCRPAAPGLTNLPPAPPSTSLIEIRRLRAEERAPSPSGRQVPLAQAAAITARAAMQTGSLLQTRAIPATFALKPHSRLRELAAGAPRRVAARKRPQAATSQAHQTEQRLGSSGSADVVVVQPEEKKACRAWVLATPVKLPRPTRIWRAGQGSESPRSSH